MSTMNEQEHGMPRVHCCETNEIYSIQPTGTGYFECPGCDRSHKL